MLPRRKETVRVVIPDLHLVLGELFVVGAMDSFQLKLAAALTPLVGSHLRVASEVKTFLYGGGRGLACSHHTGFGGAQISVVLRDFEDDFDVLEAGDKARLFLVPDRYLGGGERNVEIYISDGDGRGFSAALYGAELALHGLLSNNLLIG